MGQEDRLTGLVGFSGMKVPVRLATTAAITLSGEQTIDGVAAVTGDRVLVKDQASSVDNGIYVVDTGDWNRAADCDGPYDLVQGSVVYVNAGTVGLGFWYCTTANPITIDSSSIVWARASSVLAAVSAYIQTLLDDADAAAARATLVAAKSGANSDITNLTALTDITLPKPLHFAGRLTLATGTPVMTSDQTAKTTVYFTPYNGNSIPIYDGANMVQTTFAELSQATTDTTKSPAAVTTNSNYDLFVWNDAGTIRCTRGPAWSSDTARGTGAGTTELEMVKGVYLNKVAITNGPAANRGTYVGSIRSNGSSQIDWKLGSAAAGGGEAFLGVWNYYNRVDVAAYVFDTVDSYTYQSTTLRASNNSSTNRISFLSGMAEDKSSGSRMQLLQPSGSGDQPAIQVALDSTTAVSGDVEFQNAQPAGAAGQHYITVAFSSGPLLGFHYWQAVENCNGTGAPCTFYGDAGGGATNRLQSFRGYFKA